MRVSKTRMVLALAVAVIAVAAVVVWLRPGGTTRFDADAYKGKTGKIVVPYKGESVLYLIRDGKDASEGAIELRTKNGAITVPAGAYQPYVYYAVIRHKGRIAWTAKSQLYYGKHKKLTVKENTTQQFAVGPPVTASIDVHQEGRSAQVYMGIESVGRGGEDCTIEQSGKTGEPPAFQVLSKDGKVLWSGKFAYG